MIWNQEAIITIYQELEKNFNVCFFSSIKSKLVKTFIPLFDTISRFKTPFGPISKMVPHMYCTFCSIKIEGIILDYCNQREPF